MKNILSILFFLLASCGSSEYGTSFPVGIKLNDEFDLQVIEYFNDTFGYEIFFDDQNNGVEINRVEKVDCEDYTSAGCLGLITYKNDSMTNHRIDIYQGLRGNSYFCVLAHELGHILIGPEHLESGLMKLSAECTVDRNDTIDDLFFEYVSEIYNF